MGLVLVPAAATLLVGVLLSGCSGLAPSPRPSPGDASRANEALTEPCGVLNADQLTVLGLDGASTQTRGRICVWGAAVSAISVEVQVQDDATLERTYAELRAGTADIAPTTVGGYPAQAGRAEGTCALVVEGPSGLVIQVAGSGGAGAPKTCAEAAAFVLARPGLRAAPPAVASGPPVATFSTDTSSGTPAWFTPQRTETITLESSDGYRATLAIYLGVATKMGQAPSLNGVSIDRCDGTFAVNSATDIVVPVKVVLSNDAPDFPLDAKIILTPQPYGGSSGEFVLGRYIEQASDLECKATASGSLAFLGSRFSGLTGAGAVSGFIVASDFYSPKNPQGDPERKGKIGACIQVSTYPDGNFLKSKGELPAGVNRDFAGAPCVSLPI